MESLGIKELVIALVLLLFILFIPALVAFGRHHPARWLILAVNYFFGWTPIGWVIALLWALRMAPGARPPATGGS